MAQRTSLLDVGGARAMQRRITGFYQDEAKDWVAQLECGHSQHVRHDPPWTVREWVVTEAGRTKRMGSWIECKLCEEEAVGDQVNADR